MPQQSASSSNMMGMRNQNIIEQEMLTRLLFQLPPDTGGYPGNINPPVATSSYPTFQKPMPSQNNYLFPAFQAPARPPPAGLPGETANNSHFPVHAYPDLGNGYPNFTLQQTQNKLEMGQPATPSFGLKPG